MKPKRRRPSKRAQRVSVMLGLVPIQRPKSDPIRRKAEQLRPVVKRK